MAYPYTSYQNPYQQGYYPYQQTQQPVVQQHTPQSTIIWISGDQEAQMFPVAPNNAVTLWSQNEPVVYLKQADATGKPTLKTYDLVERVQAPTSVSDNRVSYATKDELTAVVGVVKGFDEMIGALKSDIDSMKTDIYGIAGKKKSVKKPKAEDGEEEE